VGHHEEGQYVLLEQDSHVDMPWLLVTPNQEKDARLASEDIFVAMRRFRNGAASPFHIYPRSDLGTHRHLINMQSKLLETSSAVRLYG
jgi:hypothetical protein